MLRKILAQEVRMNTKIVTKEQFATLRQSFGEENKIVVHCHGVFDLIHPGHIIHLEEAKKMGDILVVSITASSYVQKGPDRPYFNDELRLMSLAALEMVDYVLLSEAITALEIINIIQPDLYIKGKEYAVSENDVTANIDKEAAAVKGYGGKIAFTEGAIFSSTKLLNSSFSLISEELLKCSRSIKKEYNWEMIRRYIESFEDIKVLVVGEAIIDEYEFCQVQGLMSKDQAISAISNKSEKYLGGAFAIAKHLAGLSKNVTLCTMVGAENEINHIVTNQLSDKMALDLDFNGRYKTIIKRKYINKNKLREEYNKIFSINYIQNYEEQAKIDREIFYDKLKENIKNHDIVVLCDYGHGLIDEEAMEIIQSKGKFVCLNCQTNSSNYGLNIITKYNRADAFVLDEKEIKMAFHDDKTERGVLLKKLKEHLNAKHGWLTLGSAGAMGEDSLGKLSIMPSVTLNVKDTVGAGDAFFAIACLCAYLNIPIEIATLLGNIAGGQIANVLGNSEAIDKVKLLKYVSTILNV